MPFALIPFLLLVVPVLEIAVFIVVGREIGVLATLGFILVTAIIGSVLLRIQGFSVLSRIRRETDQGRLPGRELGDGLMIVAAAILLLTPGFVTDAIGFALFVPGIRGLIWRFVASRIQVHVAAGGDFTHAAGPHARNRSDRVVELEPDEFHESMADEAESRNPQRKDKPS